MPPSMEARIAEYTAALTPPSPPPSLLSPWSSPLPHIPSPPLPPLPSSSLHLPPHVPTSLPLPSSLLPPLPALLFMPPLIDRMEDIPEAELPPRKRLCLTAPTSRYEVGESSTAARRPTRGHRADYGFIGTMALGMFGIGKLSYFRELMDWSRIDSFTMRLHDGWIGRPSFPDRLGHIPLGVTDDDNDCTCFITIGTVVSGIGTDSGTLGYVDLNFVICCDPSHVMYSLCDNNMPQRRSSATARAAAADATPITADVVEQLIEARVSAALANHETLRNSTNGHGDGSHNFETRIRGTVRTP
ncbi:hypothetical protein Tco_1518480, partial [Tanacetum coccineum]